MARYILLAIFNFRQALSFSIWRYLLVAFCFHLTLLFGIKFRLLQILFAEFFVVKIKFEIFEVLEYLFISQVFQLEKVVLQGILLFIFQNRNL